MKDQRSTSREHANPLRSAFRVWLPSWRLTPFDPAPVLFRTGSTRGIHPSEPSPLKRYPGCYHPDDPTYRLAYRCSRRRSVGPAQQAAVPGIQPFRESLAIARRFSSLTAGCSLGFRPSRVPRRRSRSGLHPISSHALCVPGDESPDAPAPQSINRPSLGPVRAPHVSTWNGRDNPSRVPAPAYSRTFKRIPRPGYVFTSRCAVHYCRPTSDLWTGALALPGLLGMG